MQTSFQKLTCCDNHTFTTSTFYYYYFFFKDSLMLFSLLVNEHTVRLIMTHHLSWYTTFSCLSFLEKKQNISTKT